MKVKELIKELQKIDDPELEVWMEFDDEAGKKVDRVKKVEREYPDEYLEVGGVYLT